MLQRSHLTAACLVAAGALLDKRYLPSDVALTPTRSPPATLRPAARRRIRMWEPREARLMNPETGGGAPPRTRPVLDLGRTHPTRGGTT